MSLNEDKTRYRNIACWLLSILAFIVYSYRLHYPYEPYYDEVYYIDFVRKLIYLKEYNTGASVHPPMWHYITAFVVMAFGDIPIVFRSVSLFAGFFSLLLIYPITKKVTNSTRTALLAVFFFTFDGISLTQTRIAMMNSLMMFFMLSSLHFYLKAVEGKNSFIKRPLVYSSLLIAAALSTKLVSTSMVLFFVLLLALHLRKHPAGGRKMIKQFCVYFIVVPIAIYFFVHLLIPFLKGRTLADIWNIQVFNFQYNLSSAALQEHPYASKWWSWPFMLKPIWFYFHTEFYTTPAAVMYGILCIGNPAMLWFMPLVMTYMLANWIKKGFSIHGFALSGFLVMWLFFAMSNRLMYFHYYYNAMPFLSMALAIMCDQMWQRGGWARKGFVIFYLVLVAGMFAYWYPLLTGTPIPGNYYWNHVWFNKWI